MKYCFRNTTHHITLSEAKCWFELRTGIEMWSLFTNESEPKWMEKKIKTTIKHTSWKLTDDYNLCESAINCVWWLFYIEKMMAFLAPNRPFTAQKKNTRIATFGERKKPLAWKFIKRPWTDESIDLQWHAVSCCHFNINIRQFSENWCFNYSFHQHLY